MSKIQETYEILCRTPSDINQHLPTLRELGNRSNKLIELGTRMAVSTFGFLASTAKEVYSVDINYNNYIKNTELMCKNENRHFQFILDSSLTVDIPCGVDLIFFDTFHSRSQVSSELSRFGNLESAKYLVFHDTVSFSRFSESGKPGGVLDAIEDFLANNSKIWRIQKHYEFNNGLMVLERI